MREEDFDTKQFSSAGVSFCCEYICKKCGYRTTQICDPLFIEYRDLSHLCARCRHGNPIAGSCLRCKVVGKLFKTERMKASA